MADGTFDDPFADDDDIDDDDVDEFPDEAYEAVSLWLTEAFAPLRQASLRAQQDPNGPPQIDIQPREGETLAEAAARQTSEARDRYGQEKRKLMAMMDAWKGVDDEAGRAQMAAVEQQTAHVNYLSMASACTLDRWKEALREEGRFRKLIGGEASRLVDGTCPTASTHRRSDPLLLNVPPNIPGKMLVPASR